MAFLASCKILEKHTDMELPFTYEEFFAIAKEKVVKQVESISTSNRMSFFFATISSMIDSGAIKAGRDFKIEFGKDHPATKRKRNIPVRNRSLLI